MKKQLSQVMEFHKAFGVHFNTKQPDTLSAEIVYLRTSLMLEEVYEWVNAFRENNSPLRTEVQKMNRAKELSDILYVVFGTVLAEGLQDEIEKIFDAVHESNMSKLGNDGKPAIRSDGKILKGENYKQPDLSFLLK